MYHFFQWLNICKNSNVPHRRVYSERFRANDGLINPGHWKGKEKFSIKQLTRGLYGYKTQKNGINLLAQSRVFDTYFYHPFNRVLRRNHDSGSSQEHPASRRGSEGPRKKPDYEQGEDGSGSRPNGQYQGGGLGIERHGRKKLVGYGNGEVLLRGGYYGDKVFLVAQWKDASKNDTHKNYKWDETQQRYRQGKDREDRFILKFFISGTYSTSPLAGWASVSDIWHWKAYRSNTAGLAHDKAHKISLTKIAKSRKYVASNGKTLYFARPSDKGSAIYSSKRYPEKIKDVMPKYVINPDISGSIADVKAKGVWDNGMWTLELARKFDTGDHDVDVVFKSGAAVKGAIAVFDGVGDWHHSNSDTLLFKFE